MAKNLNKIIDNNFYPVEAARRSNMRHRPIGIGIQVDFGAVLRSMLSGQRWSMCFHVPKIRHSQHSDSLDVAY